MNNKPLKIVADENMPAVREMFAGLGEVITLPGRQMRSDQLADADILLVRSVTPVNDALLNNSPVRFVGTATIGTDHIDTALLRQREIGFSSAPGCNADAVVEYVLSALYQLADEQGFKPSDRTFGVIGAGNVGGRLVKRLKALGLSVLVNDPPRQQAGDEGLVGLDRLLAEADFICMHTPLTRDGDHPSFHLMDEVRLASLKPGAILLNAGRGPAIDNIALLNLSEQRPDLTLVLDVWEHEPVVDPRLAGQVRIVSPHIAGYSQDGKIRGTWMLYRACCQYLGLEVEHQLEHFLPRPALAEVTVNDQITPLELIRLRYDPYRDDRALRATLKQPEGTRALDFDALRKHYPVRREFASLRVKGVTDPALQQELSALGFTLAAPAEIA
ncbi:4-phosphoerythronate dehydrogenase PdxB [Marinobacterium jannaschii]|uniref:4-phosphoerythronate dehydrogenase PdxB n=1 Tax=Marinobacterium jannaschii TaxID=64970 RepID=UPI000484064B|nr:4-phosphoerythronate dehydrogenase PdxB [Marinobacterium jannaschii]